MAGEFREFSSDETSSVIPHFEGSQPVAKAKKKEEPETAKAPLNTMQLPLSNTPIVQSPDVQDVTTAVTKANQQIQQGLPTPQAPSSVKALGKEVNQVGKSVGDMLMENWVVPAGILATYGAYKLLGEKTPSTVHPSEQPQPPSNKSIRDRMLLGEVKEPTFETPVSAAPTTQAPPPVHKDAPLLQAGLENTAANALNQQVQTLQKAGAIPGSAAPVAAPTPVAPYDQGRMANMMAAQEMANPLGGQASAYTEPLRPAGTTVEPTKVEPPKNKGGRPKGAKTLTAEERAAQEAAKGINMYRNLFGFETSNPTSPKSLAAIEATNRFISESFSGKIPGSRDPFLNPSTDIGASGKKFYSGTPEGYRNNYIPWLEKNLNTLPPETQSHILQSMTKGQAGDIGKILKSLGIAATGLGAAGIAFAETPKERQAAAKEFAFDLATGIPLTVAVGGPAAAVGAMALGSSGLNKREDEQLARIKAQERQAALLGSPYASTEWAKQQRKGVPPPR